MKKLFTVFALGAISISASFAQSTDQGRDLSKYADDKFGEDDKYHVETPYRTVKVGPVKKNARIKNVIVLIGDGMGLEQISTGWTLNGGHLNLDNFPVAGYSRTWASDRLVTDSSAGGTGISSGIKTKYGYIGVDDDGRPVESLLHYAQSLGMKTGVTVTCRINDSTPADFVCHSTDRHEEEAIAAQYVGCGVDFLSGGGLKFWTERSDGRNLVDEMKGLG